MSDGSPAREQRDLMAAPLRVLAIDGPAGAGKSTLAARMAARFGLLNIETGAMYRAFGLKAEQTGTCLEDAEALTRLSQETRIVLEPGADGNKVLLDGVDVSGQLRTPETTQAASRVSVHGPVRAWMVQLQQELGLRAPGGVVMEGRDIGTVVFPQASIKIFLSASAEARTDRRLLQDRDKEQDRSEPIADPHAVLAAIRERDERDQTRAESPLRAASDAVVIDSTALSLDQVAEQVAQLVAERWKLSLDAARSERAGGLLE